MGGGGREGVMSVDLVQGLARKNVRGSVLGGFLLGFFQSECSSIGGGSQYLIEDRMRSKDVAEYKGKKQIFDKHV
jgi:hypothetical protein